MGNSSPVDEPYWEVKGGNEIPYGFRINNSGEIV